VITASLFYLQEKDHLINLAIEKSSDISKLHATSIGDLIQYNATAIGHFAKSDQFINSEKDRILHSIKCLRDEPNSIFLNVSYIDSKGNSASVGNESGNVSDSDYFNILKSKSPSYTISKPFIEETLMHPVIAIAVPIIDSNNKFKGAISATIDLRTLSRELTSVKLPGKSYGWIVDDSGMVIAHPKSEYHMKVNVTETDDIGYPGLSAIGKEMLVSDEGVGEYEDTNIDEYKIVTYALIPNTPGWKLGITTLKKDIYAPVNTLLKLILPIIAVVSIMLIMITSNLSKKITRPLQELTFAINASKALEFKPLVIKESYSEIGIFVQAYNTMSASLQEYTAKLENLVEERTNELYSLNRQLDTRNKRLTNMNDRLYDMAIRDKLTGLLNRRHLNVQINLLIEEINISSKTHFSILFMDIDNFKYYNDTFGHDIGDKILVDFSKQLINWTRTTDLVARYGGDEFVIAFPDTDYDNATIISQKLSDSIDETNGYIDLIREWKEDDTIEISEENRLGLSVGVATYLIDTYDSVDELIKEADDRMYQNKFHRKSNIKNESA
jgi:diguanylate cyclase (GGDEF)-like protein